MAPPTLSKKAYSPPVADLAIAATTDDLAAALSKCELRALAAAARALAARADQALLTDSPSFPSAFPLQLVTAWLPLPDIASALRLSTAWYEASEPTFKIVSRRPRHDHKNARHLRPGMTVVLEAMHGEPECRLRVTKVDDDCVGGYSPGVPAAPGPDGMYWRTQDEEDFYEEFPKTHIKGGPSEAPWREVVRHAIVINGFKRSRHSPTGPVIPVVPGIERTFEKQVFTAAQSNNVEALRLVLQTGLSPSCSNDCGQTAVHIAALWGSLDALSLLIAQGADLNIQNSFSGATPLHFLASRDDHAVQPRLDAAALLIAAGADARFRDDFGEYPYQKVLLTGDSEKGARDLRARLKAAFDEQGARLHLHRMCHNHLPSDRATLTVEQRQRLERLDRHTRGDRPDSLARLAQRE